MLFISIDWSAWVNGTCLTNCEQNRTRHCSSEPCTGDAWEVTSCDYGDCVIEGLSRLLIALFKFIDPLMIMIYHMESFHVNTLIVHSVTLK